MSSEVGQQSIWTPPVIATIVYRVVMIIVSIAFIWKKYHRPARQTDEEQLVGVLLPAVNSPIRRTQSPNERSRRNHSTHGRHYPTLREVIVASLEDAILSALGLGEDDNKIDMPSLSSDDPSITSSRNSADVSSLGTDLGVDIDPGHMGLRHRSADSLSDNKKLPHHSSLKEDA